MTKNVIQNGYNGQKNIDPASQLSDKVSYKLDFLILLDFRRIKPAKAACSPFKLTSSYLPCIILFAPDYYD